MTVVLGILIGAIAMLMVCGYAHMKSEIDKAERRIETLERKINLRTYRSYRSLFNKPKVTKTDKVPPVKDPEDDLKRKHHEIERLKVNSYAEASGIADDLIHDVETFGYASVARYLSRFKTYHCFTDENIGWTNLTDDNCFPFEFDGEWYVVTPPIEQLNH